MHQWASQDKSICCWNSSESSCAKLPESVENSHTRLRYCASHRLRAGVRRSRRSARGRDPSFVRVGDNLLIALNHAIAAAIVYGPSDDLRLLDAVAVCPTHTAVWV